MSGFVVPRALADLQRRHPEPGRAQWLARLPEAVESVARRWSLRLGPPFQPGGQSAWVAPARDPAGRDLVLKVGWRHDEAWHEADGLRFWDGVGAVRLYAAESADTTSALLLERCVPGTPLTRLLPEPEQDLVVAGLLRRLWRVPPPGCPFRDLAVMCGQWADGFDAARSLDPGLVRAGLALFRELPASADRAVLLCTDLHGDNILAARREPWLVIDPKPYLGDPTYDPLQHMLNCPDRLVADPAGLARRMAGLLDLDGDRLVRWLFARCVVESGERPLLGEVANRLAAHV